ncbi:MAG: ABC transporter ATP-binding protein [Ferruginibacter sp.]
MAIAIQSKHLSKAYQLGEFSTGTLSQDIERLWFRVRGKDDPFLKVGETNDRSVKGSSNMVWSLKDISFDIHQGDAVGIIGRNGAGKSTLLKILSRVTTPTAGSVKVKGRIASLLEVGTGFHPELTGRENIFLNGAILGMRKAEIKRKFDEIVDFSGVERYIDTPVKRYSSGMYVRLAFAVAAHLESEILIVDEVLAVGDAEFQKKCLGKMGEVSVEKGRTVLFVSHNLSAIETICRRGIYLKTGMIQYIGGASDTVVNYLSNETKNSNVFEFQSALEAPGNEHIKLMSGFVKNADNNTEIIDVSSPADISFDIINTSADRLVSAGFDLLNLRGDVIFGSGGFFDLPLNKRATITCKIPANFLNDGSYTITFYVHDKNMAHLLTLKDVIGFEVKDIEREHGYLGKINGAVRPKLQWEVNS